MTSRRAVKRQASKIYTDTATTTPKPDINSSRGLIAPYRGKDKQSLTAEQQRIDQQTRADVIEELGHGRSRETKTYLG
jgi:hypothetical protein